VVLKKYQQKMLRAPVKRLEQAAMVEQEDSHFSMIAGLLKLRGVELGHHSFRSWRV
jgi:hypothetical protein